ncbi:hypothetical protein PPROV_000793400 [Pycnococcus provasolii]|uniref:phosphoribosylamine--glycine ligase n=1 Tax=Pycnococcus provasolii TaxID=41880 RepID=A0A830HWC1_9CHLO|nr:hypothetical protein PPROV_000793400 [Pycnococcus provasolii]
MAAARMRGLGVRSLRGRSSCGQPLPCRYVSSSSSSPSSSRLSRSLNARASSSASQATQKTNVLVVGGGGREHALAWRLRQAPSAADVFVCPGNAGTADDGMATPAPLSDADFDAVAAFCEERDVQLVVVGPEAPLVAGLADHLRERNIRVFGPSAAAAKLEGSKAFMKDLCAEMGIPTAAFQTFSDPESAKKYVVDLNSPVVVKTDGLAAGKGVLMCETVDEALDAIDAIMVDEQFGAEAGSTIVVEALLRGEELSFFALCDGKTAIPFASAQDHKRLLDGDEGPNTGGMGAYSPAPIATPEMESAIMKDLVLPTVDGMAKRGCPFTGVLFAGIMVVDGKPMLLEHNVRFGDPECEALMLRYQGDLVEVLMRAADGELDKLDDDQVSGPNAWNSGTAMTVVLAANGYPGSYAKGTRIAGLSEAEQTTPPDGCVKIFHAGTSEGAAPGEFAANGGRVLAVTAMRDNVRDAAASAYEAVGKVQWDDMVYRKDIGFRAMQ